MFCQNFCQKMFFRIDSFNIKFFKIKPMICSALVTLSLAGCTSLTTPLIQSSAEKARQVQAPEQWLARQAVVADINRFTLKGRVALINDATRFSANFLWQQRGNNTSLRLTSFLGSTLVKLDVTPQGAVLIDDQGRRFSGSDPTTLLERLTDVTLPIEQMVKWIKGQVTPENSYELTKDNRLAVLYQYHSPLRNPGWQVTYNAYDPKTNNLLPSRISMINTLANPNIGEQRVNLVISEWTLYP